MATLRCKMCGGTLEVRENETVAVCEYCFSKQTVPKYDDERIMNMFERANHYRAQNEFDNASAVYDDILYERPDNAEAHWGLCICRYGIEYVEDPKTQKRVPTCHRTQFKSILQDSDYIAAIENSDPLSQDIYRQEAEYIDKIQKDILAISSKEEPFDIFICYKETDENGDRTLDSVHAQEIYDMLTEKGYKVFFSRITLKGKLGVAYEPYIFAALNSAKIMLAVGTKPEYFQAVWLKNEWSRFLSMIEQGQKKILIPCFRHISPEELPAEFAALQGQDMSKLTWKHDLSEAISVLAPLNKNQSTQEQPQTVNTNFKTTTPPNNGLLNQINTVVCAGTNDPNDYWPRASISSVVDITKFNYLSFQLTMRERYRKAGTVNLSFKVYDYAENLITHDVTPIHVEYGNDRLAKILILVGDDGTRMGDGFYRAEFMVEGSSPVSYRFQIVSGKQKQENKNTTDYTPKNYTHKSRLIYTILAYPAFGMFGLHSFYAGKKRKGKTQLILGILGITTPISMIWAFFDFIIGIFSGVPDPD